jgi:hypothetical protein
MPAEAAKNVQASRPSRSRNAKPGRATPSMYVNATEYTTTMTSGLINDHRNPRAEPRYLSLRSRRTRWRASDRYCIRSFALMSNERWPPAGSMPGGDGALARARDSRTTATVDRHSAPPIVNSTNVPAPTDQGSAIRPYHSHTVIVAAVVPSKAAVMKRRRIWTVGACRYARESSTAPN